MFLAVVAEETMVNQFLGDTMKITEKTRCWICHRSSKELKNAIETYWKSGYLGKDMDLDACFELMNLRAIGSKEKTRIPVCVICSQLILQYVLAYLRDNLEVTVKTKDPKVSINL